MNLRWAVPVALVACGGRAEVASGNVKRVDPPAAAPRLACITPPDVATIEKARATGGRIEYCVGDAECFALELASGAFERLREPPKSGDAAAARVETQNPRLEVCKAGSCKALTPNVLPSSTRLRAATNTEGTIAVILLGDAAKGKGYAEVWDVTAAKRTATFRYARGDFQCGEVAMLDAKTIFVNATQCGQPAARAGLYRIDGRKIANVGGKDFGTFGGAVVQAEGDSWVFLEENANQLVVQDITKGKIIKTIDTTSLFKTTNAEMGNPGESALVRLDAGRVAIVAGAPATGSVAVVELASGAITLMPVPICK
jgi:hypothetical protein